MAVTINASTTNGLIQTADTSGTLALQANGTTVLSASPTGVAITGTITATGTTLGGVGQQATVLTSPGTFTTPASTTQIKVTVIGAGGGAGGGGPAGAQVGAGGGAGGLNIAYLTVSASTPYPITVGTGGAGGAGGTAGSPGGSSSAGPFGPGGTVTSTGGSGGANGSPSATGGAGGAGGGYGYLTGQRGSPATGPGQGGSGGAGSNINPGGITSSSQSWLYGMFGGQAVGASTSPTQTGINGGGGGGAGGPGSFAGGTGGNGLVIIEY